MAHISREKACMLGTQFHFLGDNIITKTDKARYTHVSPGTREAEEGWRPEHRSLRPEWMKSDFKNKRNLRQMTQNKSLKFPPCNTSTWKAKAGRSIQASLDYTARPYLRGGGMMKRYLVP